MFENITLFVREYQKVAKLSMGELWAIPTMLRLGLVENIRRVNVQYRVYLNEKNERVVFQKPYFELENNALVLKNIPVDPNQIRAKDFYTTEKKKLTQEVDSPLSGGLSTKRASKNWHRDLQNINLFRNIKEIKGSGC